MLARRALRLLLTAATAVAAAAAADYPVTVHRTGPTRRRADGAATRTFRMGFAYLGQICDFGWTMSCNEGRMATHKEMETLHPDWTVESVFKEIFPGGGFGNQPLSEDMSYDELKKWAEEIPKFDIIYVGSFNFHAATLRAAQNYPTIAWSHLAGYYDGPENWQVVFAKLFQGRYLAGIVAGGVAKHRNPTRQKVCYVASIPISEVKRQANAFLLGVKKAAPSAEVVMYWLGTFIDPAKETAIALRMVEMGCDVMAHHSDTRNIPVEAARAGKLSIGTNGDIRRVVGESVLISHYFDWSKIWIDQAKAAADGTFRANNFCPGGGHEETCYRGLWYGMDKGAVLMSEPSFQVPAHVRTMMDAEHAVILADTKGSYPFCGTITKEDGTKAALTDGCLTSYDVAMQDYLLAEWDGVVDFFKWPGEVCPSGTKWEKVVTATKYDFMCTTCGPGTYSNWNGVKTGDPTTGCAGTTDRPPEADAAEECTPCEAGTYQPGTNGTACLPCDIGYYSGSGAAGCAACPSGTTNSEAGSPSCPVVYVSSGDEGLDPLTVIGVCVAVMVVAVVILVGSFTLWRNRAFRNAPLRGDITLVFTDIANSTKLWGSDRAGMSEAIKLHDSTLHSALKAHRGYFVKGAGDSFMCAFDDPVNAVAFMLDAQQMLLKVQWPASVLKQELASEKKITDSAGRPIVHFRGPRVRMGGHVGTPEVKRGQFSVDYFGPDVNLAARVSDNARGGEILVTQDLYEAVEEHLLDVSDVFGLAITAKHSGNVELQGIAGLTTVVQIEPTMLEGRVFATNSKVADQMVDKSTKNKPAKVAPLGGKKIDGISQEAMKELMQLQNELRHVLRKSGPISIAEMLENDEGLRTLGKATPLFDLFIAAVGSLAQEWGMRAERDDRRGSLAESKRYSMASAQAEGHRKKSMNYSQSSRASQARGRVATEVKMSYSHITKILKPLPPQKRLTILQGLLAVLRVRGGARSDGVASPSPGEPKPGGEQDNGANGSSVKVPAALPPAGLSVTGVPDSMQVSGAVGQPTPLAVEEAEQLHSATREDDSSPVALVSLAPQQKEPKETMS